MHEGGLAVIGDKDSVFAFSAIGVDVFPADTAEEAKEKLHALARTYKIIFITDKLAEGCGELIKRYKTRPFPAVIPIPSGTGSTGLGMRGIRADVEKAIGTDILFRKEDK